MITGGKEKGRSAERGSHYRRITLEENTSGDKRVCSPYGDEFVVGACRLCRFVTMMLIRSQGGFIMARTASTISLKTFLLVGALLPAAAVFAQQKPSDKPPQLETIEPGSDTPVTITPQTRSSNKISQTKDGGRVTEVQVNAGGSHYTMKGVRPGSVTDINDQSGASLRPPQWKVMEFDLSKKKKTDPEGAAAADGTANAPPPQTVK